MLQMRFQNCSKHDSKVIYLDSNYLDRNYSTWYDSNSIQRKRTNDWKLTLKYDSKSMKNDLIENYSWFKLVSNWFKCDSKVDSNMIPNLFQYYPDRNFSWFKTEIETWLSILMIQMWCELHYNALNENHFWFKLVSKHNSNKIQNDSNRIDSRFNLDSYFIKT